jgi:hypothetical protein
MGLNRGAILLLSAHLEGYLEDLMEECLQQCHTALDGSSLRRGFMNPTADRIDTFFALLGIKNPTRSKLIAWRNCSNGRVRNSLADLVQARNQIAHGTQRTVHKKQVLLLKGHVERFSSRFDDVVRAHMRSLLGYEPW